MAAPALLALLLAAGARAEPDYAALVAQTTAAYTVTAVVGPLETPLAPEWAGFLLDHLDLTSALVRARGLGPYEIAAAGPGRFAADDHDGTKALVTLVRSLPGSRLYYAEGTHAMKVFPKVRVAAAVFLEQRPVDAPGCPGHVRTTFTVYARLRSRLLSAMVKALRPLLRDAIVRKLSRAFLVAHKLGVLLAQDPGPVAKDILASPLLSPAGRGAAAKLILPLRPQPPACLALGKP